MEEKKRTIEIVEPYNNTNNDLTRDTNKLLLIVSVAVVIGIAVITAFMLCTNNNKTNKKQNIVGSNIPKEYISEVDKFKSVNTFLLKGTNSETKEEVVLEINKYYDIIKIEDKDEITVYFKIDGEEAYLEIKKEMIDSLVFIDTAKRQLTYKGYILKSQISGKDNYVFYDKDSNFLGNYTCEDKCGGISDYVGGIPTIYKDHAYIKETKGDKEEFIIYDIKNKKTLKKYNNISFIPKSSDKIAPTFELYVMSGGTTKYDGKWEIADHKGQIVFGREYDDIIVSFLTMWEDDLIYAEKDSKIEVVDMKTLDKVIPLGKYGYCNAYIPGLKVIFCNESKETETVLFDFKGNQIDSKIEETGLMGQELVLKNSKGEYSYVSSTKTIPFGKYKEIHLADDINTEVDLKNITYYGNTMFVKIDDKMCFYGEDEKAYCDLKIEKNSEGIISPMYSLTIYEDGEEIVKGSITFNSYDQNWIYPGLE